MEHESNGVRIFQFNISCGAIKTTLQKAIPGFPIVGIGAGAGSLDAIIKIIPSIPDDSSMAYIVQQISSDNSVNPAEILSQYTNLPVHEIVNEINLAPNQIYVMPENNDLVMEDGVLKLYLRNRSDKINKTIDAFFESLAEVYESFVIGLLLSGNAFDGTTGFKRIREVGGTTIAQDPETAVFRGMPQNAIDAGVVDYIATPENMIDKVIQIAISYYINDAYNDRDLMAKDDEKLLFEILNLVFLRTGNDFRHYRQPTIRRCIAHRMVICKKDSIEDYYNYLRNNKTEQDHLFNDLLIPVTYFFRDAELFDSLPNLVFSQLIQNNINNSLRIWAAGCAKTHKRTHQDIGQLQMYVNYYDRIEKNENENPTIGILLCANKNDGVVKFTLPESNKSIIASQYHLYLPTEQQLLEEVNKELANFEDDKKES